MILGCIGDDFTGSSDLANTLARGGMRTVQYNGVPAEDADPAIEAGVVALKTRTIAPADAVAQSLAALDWLRRQGCRQFLFKYCSTFDSTAEGNIGPVLDALSDALGVARVIVCPAFPATGRSIYQGHLFVNDRLLNESGMEKHPLTPMTDPDLRRWLALQTRHDVGHIGYEAVAAGPAAIAAAMDKIAGEGSRYLVVDALFDADLMAIGEAAAHDLLLSGGSGIALGLPANFRNAGLIGSLHSRWVGEKGPAAALCGSCSIMSRRQIAWHREKFPARMVDAHSILQGRATPEDYADWVLANMDAGGPPLVYSSAEPEDVAQVQKQYGTEKAAGAIEGFFAALSRRLVSGGVRRLICAGGETSGAVISGLAIPSMEIGPEIDPGVPALRARDSGLALALKSGNFGGPDFFAKAARILEGDNVDE